MNRSGVRARHGRPEALAIHQRLLELNPNDNQGVRYLIGAEYLQVGDDKATIEAFSKRAEEEVGCAFGLALARPGAFGPSADASRQQGVTKRSNPRRAKGGLRQRRLLSAPDLPGRW